MMKSWQNDFFDHLKYASKEKDLKKIPCPIKGTDYEIPSKDVPDIEEVKPRLIEVDPIQDKEEKVIEQH